MVNRKNRLCYSKIVKHFDMKKKTPEIIIVEFTEYPINYDFGTLWKTECVPHLDSSSIKRAVAK